MTACFKSWKVALALTVSAALTPVLRAAERVTLANGFELVCDHHALVDGRVRLYSRASALDYMDLSAESVRGFEHAADPVPEIAPAVEDASAGQATTSSGPGLAGPNFSSEKLTAVDLHELLSRAGSEHNVDADLLASLVKAESGGNARAVSRTGARGLMQLMPGTARELGVANSFQPEENVRGGTAYFDGLLTRYRNNIALALAAYNAGPEAVDRYRGVPPYRETRAYVARVIHEFNRRVAARRSANSARSGLGAQ